MSHTHQYPTTPDLFSDLAEVDRHPSHRSEHHLAGQVAGPHTSARRLERAELEDLLTGATAPQHFIDCDFDGADLSRLDLRGATFSGCSLAETSLYAANLGQTVWRKCRGREADFEAADLVDAMFQQSDFNNAKWRRAKLSAVVFKGCKLTGASFEEAACLGLRFEDTLLVGADLRKLSFRKQQLEQLDFSDADLAGCDFRDAVFIGGSLRHAQLRLAHFEGADLRQADLGGLKLLDARLFKGATISHRQAAAMLAELGLAVA